MIQKVIALILGAVAVPLSVPAFQETKAGHDCVIKGRVVDERGQPVSAAIVVLVPKTPGESWESMIIYHKTNSEGRFCIKADDVPADREQVLYVTTEPPPDAEVPVSPPFAGMGVNNPSFSGRHILISETNETELGDVPLQVRYGSVFVYLINHSGAPLSFDSDKIDISKFKLRVRDARGDVVGERWISEKAFHSAESLMSLALPEGQWQLEVASAEGNALIWHRASYPLVVRLIGSPLKVFLRARADRGEVTNQPMIVASDPGAARQKLKEMGITFTKKAFFDRLYRQNADAVILFLVAGIDVNAKGKYGNTALMAASAIGSTDIVRELLSRGANVNARNNFGATALMLAAAGFNSDIVGNLLDRGAQINEKAKDGKTALMMAVANDQRDNVKVLLGAGADVNLKDESGKTAIQLASELGRTQVIELLKRFGAR